MSLYCFYFAVDQHGCRCSFRIMKGLLTADRRSMSQADWIPLCNGTTCIPQLTLVQRCTLCLCGHYQAVNWLDAKICGAQFLVCVSNCVMHVIFFFGGQALRGSGLCTTHGPIRTVAQTVEKIAPKRAVASQDPRGGGNPPSIAPEMVAWVNGFCGRWRRKRFCFGHTAGAEFLFAPHVFILKTLRILWRIQW